MNIEQIIFETRFPGEEFNINDFNDWAKENEGEAYAICLSLCKHFINKGISGVELIAIERKKQIDKHGFTGKHHADHPEWYDNFQLQYAATTLMMHEFEEVVDTKDNLPDGWDQEWFNRINNRSRKERLIIAGALIAAEIDRMNFLVSPDKKEHGKP